MQPDFDEARRFLAALSSDTRHTFQTFDDQKRGGQKLTRVLHGTLQAQFGRLSELNAKGAGVFVTVNRTDGKGRTAANIEACRALFLDLDGAPLEPVEKAPIKPRIVVESSPDKWHAYWPIVDLPTQYFSDAQKKLARDFGGDTKVNDLPRVMRLPGFVHAKGKPFLSRLVRCESAPLTWSEACDAFGFARPMRLAQIIPEGERNSTLFRLARSAAKKGVPATEQLRKLQMVNASRCSTPLADDELRRINESAYRTAQGGHASIPLAVLDSDAYRALSHAGRVLTLIAYRRADGFAQPFSLAWSECKPWFSDQKRFYAVRTEVLKSGLVDLACDATPPRAGKSPTAALYRLPIGGQNTPYAVRSIGGQNTPPEAFQVVAEGG